MAKLITGGTGYIGSELARILANRGEEIVLFDIAINRYRIEDIEKKVKIVRGDVSNAAQVNNVVKDNHITELYHLGSMLTYVSENDPWASFQTNVIGTCNILEACRLFGVKKMLFTSTMGTFGMQFTPVITDTTLQRPITMYGCGKLYCEGLGRFYHNKFGLDFRSVRFSHMVGPNVRTPGHWAPAMIEDAIMGKPNDCVYGDPSTAVSLIYVTDAARSVDLLAQSPIENIKMMNYNVSGIPRVVTAGELEGILQKRYPESRVNYQTDTGISESARRVSISMEEFNDDYARREWGWKPLYGTPETIIDIFERDVKNYPQRYGLTA
jgi:threonine 3-dehydrogenase